MATNLTYVSRDTMTEIADAIRAKNGETTTYKPTEMAAAINTLDSSSGGVSLADVSVYVGDYADSDTLSVDSGAVNIYGRYITT